MIVKKKKTPRQIGTVYSLLYYLSDLDQDMSDSRFRCSVC